MAVIQAPEIYELIIRNTDYKYLGETIHLFVGGSAAHGAKLEHKGDLDLYGVYIPPMETMVGITDSDEHYVWSTSGDKVRNGPDDIDMNMYSIRKWAGMAASGNPTALEFLYTNNLAPKGTIWEQFILPNRHLFLCTRAGYHFQKFCEHMLRTLKGEGTGKRGQRPDLIGEFGYDTKAAMHLIRVLNEGIELMETGKITLPRPEKEFLINIRLGKAGTLADIEAMAMERFDRLEKARLASSLPAEVNRSEITKVVLMAQQQVWNQSNEVLRVMSKAFSVATWWISEDCRLHPVEGRKQWENQKQVEADIIALAIELHKKEAEDAAAKSNG